MGNCIAKKTRSVRVAQPVNPLQDPVPPEGTEWKDCAPFVPNITKGRVIKVYDGDTIHVATYPDGDQQRPGEKIPRFSIRLLRIDAPEIRTKDLEEKEYAYKARNYLTNLIMGKVVDLQNITREPKWGRILAEVYFEGQNLSDLMLENRWVVPYDGGTKQTPDSWAAYHASTA